MNCSLVVQSSWKATYGDPVVVKAGDTVFLSDRRDNWDGYIWVWALGPGGKEGWVPDTLIEYESGRRFAKEYFSAAELTCSEGEILNGIKEIHGWTWCVAHNGREGWVPSRNLKRR